MSNQLAGFSSLRRAWGETFRVLFTAQLLWAAAGCVDPVAQPGPPDLASASADLASQPVPDLGGPPDLFGDSNAITFDKTQVRIGDTLMICSDQFPWVVSMTHPLEYGVPVTFNGTKTPVRPNLSTPKCLVVTVPDGIPGAPTMEGQSLDAIVRVQPSTGPAFSRIVTILPQSPTMPTIVKVEPASAALGGAMTIIGTNFGNDMSKVNVYVSSSNSTTGGTLLTLKAPFSSTTLSATLPISLPGLNSAGDFQDYNLRVEVANEPPAHGVCTVYKP